MQAQPFFASSTVFYGLKPMTLTVLLSRIFLSFSSHPEYWMKRLLLQCILVLDAPFTRMYCRRSLVLSASSNGSYGLKRPFRKSPTKICFYFQHPPTNRMA